MINIFNSFDPINYYRLRLNWLTLIIPFLFIFSSYWLVPSRWRNLINNIIITINNELNLTIKSPIYKISYIRVFLIFIILNLTGLLSYVFSRTRHIVINLRISLPLWLIIIILGWFLNRRYILTHQVPIGTPPILIPFIVLIETIRNIIRPGTLSIRLTANIIAGHLLLTLIRRLANKLIILFIFILVIIQILLIILELSVSIIQAYVFITLLRLYSQEIDI